MVKVNSHLPIHLLLSIVNVVVIGEIVTVCMCCIGRLMFFNITIITIIVVSNFISFVMFCMNSVIATVVASVNVALVFVGIMISAR